MNPKPTPLIKGMFVASHVQRLRREKGDAAIAELERRYGKPVVFRNLEDVPVREEIEIIGIVLDLLEGRIISDPGERAFESGRLHFRNFSTTTFGNLLLSTVPKTSEGIRKMILSLRYIGRHIFKNTNFSAQEKGPASMLVVMENNDYPIDHFRGLFFEWLAFWELPSAGVTALETMPGRYEYVLFWSAPHVI